MCAFMPRNNKGTTQQCYFKRFLFRFLRIVRKRQKTPLIEQKDKTKYAKVINNVPYHRVRSKCSINTKMYKIHKS